MIICPHCGIRNRINSNFCNHCGADLRAESTAARADESGPATGQDDANDVAAESNTGAVRYFDDGDPYADAVDVHERDAGVGDDGADTADDLAPPAEPEAFERPALRDPLAQLSSDIQGLLTPHVVSSVTSNPAQADEHENPLAGLAEADLRRVRHLLGNEPTLTNAPLEVSAAGPPTLRIPWLFGLLGLFMLLAFLVNLPDLPGQPPALPGVSAAYRQIEDLADNRLVLVWWAYDPATAGEMDLIALPLLRHLTARQQQLFLFSPLPTGVATAERLFTRLDAEINLRGSAAALRSADYLPGGPAIMPLLGQSLALAARDTTLQGRLNANPAASAPVTPEQPALALVVAAQAEDVQNWLEQVQPRNHTPVVAITGAAADPILRPYWDSGQLAGLVSGVDGGLAYEVLLNNAVAANAEAIPRLSQLALGARHQMVQIQNWGHIGFALIILLGNLAILVHRA
ncbi:MAG: zinc ribbon domain-containing protein [Caldilineaceae bacterium]|nr:zinc ribbon domain-containing protein [Caldilineaceae bacterium]